MIETLTAGAIAKLVFDGAIQAGAGKLTEAGLAQAQQLWQKIRGKVKEEGVQETTFSRSKNYFQSDRRSLKFRALVSK